MAKLVPPPQTIRTAVTGSHGAEQFANIFWSYIGGVNTPQADFDGWNTKFLTAFTTNIGPILFPETVVKACSSTLFVDPDHALHTSATVNTPGTSSGTPVNDLSASRVLSWSSNVYWRGGKPRTYIAGLGTTDTTDGKLITDALRASLATVAQNLHAAINALSQGNIVQTQHGFVSFYSGGVLRAPAVFFPILGGTAHKRIGSQRGRLGPWVP